MTPSIDYGLVIAEEPVRSILLVEDSAADVALTREVLHDLQENIELLWTENIVGALEILHQRAAHSNDSSKVDLVLLDLNLPSKRGAELIETMRKTPSLRRIPIIVLTTSDSDLDVNLCYDLGANAYIVKPREYDLFASYMRAITDFWMHLNRAAN